MAPSRGIKLREYNTLTRKIPYRRIPRQKIVVKLSKEYLSMAYRGKETN